jgi:hypothetical protein
MGDVNCVNIDFNKLDKGERQFFQRRALLENKPLKQVIIDALREKAEMMLNEGSQK